MTSDNESLKYYRLGDVKSVFYIQDFVTEKEHNELLDNIYNKSDVKWTQLSNRRLQNHGGLPHEKGMIAQPLPTWLLSVSDDLRQQWKIFGDRSPNHVLINEYESKQGIMPHKDGPVYEPIVCILSLESGILITFNVDEHDDEYIEQRKELEPHQKHFSVFMEPRSMLLFSEDVYHHYLHSIEEEESTTLTEDKNILNLDQLKGLELGSTIQRTKRVSLTYRIVKRTISKNKWIRL